MGDGGSSLPVRLFVGGVMNGRRVAVQGSEVVAMGERYKLTSVHMFLMQKGPVQLQVMALNGNPKYFDRYVLDCVG